MPLQKITNGHVKMGLYLRSYEVTGDHLHGSPHKWDYNCVLSKVLAIESSALLGLSLTGTDSGLPLGVTVIGGTLYCIIKSFLINPVVGFGFLYPVMY